ncbi:TPA: hypothetical protein ACGO2H_000394 [Streptococcus suis]
MIDQWNRNASNHFWEIHSGITRHEEAVREKALQEGIEQGIEQGVIIRNMEIEQNLLPMGVPVDQMSQGTGLSVADILNLATSHS